MEAAPFPGPPGAALDVAPLQKAAAKGPPSATPAPSRPAKRKVRVIVDCSKDGRPNTELPGTSGQGVCGGVGLERLVGGSSPYQ